MRPPEPTSTQYTDVVAQPSSAQRCRSGSDQGARTFPQKRPPVERFLEAPVRSAPVRHYRVVRQRGGSSKIASTSAAMMLVIFLGACGDAAGTTVDRTTGGSGAAPADQPTDCQTFSVTAYPLPDDPKVAVAFAGNPEIFEATVQRAESATKAMQPGMTVPFLVYVPVYVTVTKVYKGTASVGATAVLRDLGGTAADCTTFVTDSIPDSVWVPGTEVFVFANEATSPEGKTALTPNWVFLEENGTFRSVASGQRMDLQELRTSVAERWPRL